MRMARYIFMKFYRVTILNDHCDEHNNYNNDDIYDIRFHVLLSAVNMI